MDNNFVRKNLLKWDELDDLESTTPFDEINFKRLCILDSFILDIGCAYGRICNQLEELGYSKIFGVDFSITQLKKAQQLLRCTKLVRADASFIPFKELSFNHAISFGIINNMIDEAKLIIFISEIARVLKPGGYWFINMYSRNDSKYFDEKYESGLNAYGIKRCFISKTGIIFRHYSIAEFLIKVDPFFDLLRCEMNNFLSMTHSKNVTGFSIILKKPTFVSKFR